jgi:type I restriction enzyme M protein
VLETWWGVARQLRDGRKVPEVRHELLTTIKDKLVRLGVLDEFKSAGVFVNWWQQIRYDLKTIISTGWHHTLIPDDYLIAPFFPAEADAIEALEAKINETQSELAEAAETAQEVAAYEPEEDEAITAAVVKKALKELIDDLEGSKSDSARKELKALQAQESTMLIGMLDMTTGAMIPAIRSILSGRQARGKPWAPHISISGKGSGL